jgi:pyruvate kinase
MPAPRRTKIVCTLGPASADEATIDRLIAAGMNVARLNMSHGTREEHAEVLARVRRRAAARKTPVAVLQDLQGPKIRIGRLAGGRPVTLVTGAEVEITTRTVVGTAERLSTPYQDLIRDVGPGDRIMLADGQIELRVRSVGDDAVQCVVVNGGHLFERQGINLPGVNVAAPSLMEKDIADLAWGIAQGVDYVAVSFVRRPEDLEAARDVIRRAGADIPLIAKLEKRQALERLDDILRAADGVMVARGDMGVELPPEEVPGWQKRIIAAAGAHLVPAITATQMLESMVHSPRPTRAETTDVANAIWDGTDAVMLSAETAVGEHPSETVAMMDRIARAAERDRAYLHIEEPPSPLPDFAHAVGRAARIVTTALPDVAAIVAFTREGATARLMSKEHPTRPILALTHDETTYRRMALYRGVHPLLSPPASALGELLREAERAAREARLAGSGDALLVVGHLPPEVPGSTNFMMLHRIA